MFWKKSLMLFIMEAHFHYKKNKDKSDFYLRIARNKVGIARYKLTI